VQQQQLLAVFCVSTVGDAVVLVLYHSGGWQNNLSPAFVICSWCIIEATNILHSSGCCLSRHWPLLLIICSFF